MYKAKYHVVRYYFDGQLFYIIAQSAREADFHYHILEDSTRHKDLEVLKLTGHELNIKLIYDDALIKFV